MSEALELVALAVYAVAVMIVVLAVAHELHALWCEHETKNNAGRGSRSPTGGK